MKLVELPHKINTLFVKATANVDTIRSMIFNILLIVSALAAFIITVVAERAFIKPNLAVYVRIIMLLWILSHVPLFYLSRTGKKILAYTIYLYLAFILVSSIFQFTILSDFNKVVLQVPETYTLLFVALLLLPYFRFFLFSTLVCISLIILVMISHDMFLPPHGINAAAIIITQIIGIWLLSIVVSGILQLHYKKVLESREELANHNEQLEVEVAANVKKIKIQQEQLYQAQKLEALGQLAGGLSHDFNNYLTAIVGFSKLAAKKVKKDSPVWQNINQIIRAGDKLTRLTKQLLLFSRKQPMIPNIINVNNTIDGLLKMLNRLIREDITIKTELAENIPTILADEVNIEQVIVNLVVNARDAMPDGGTLTIRTENVTISKEDLLKIPNSREGNYVCISVEDGGVGISTETQKKIFEPFFTTKEIGKGTGLGLSVIYGIVSDHKGWISVFSREGKGTVFKIYLTVERLPFTVRKKGNIIQSDAEELCGNGEKVLVIEDQEEILNFCETSLNNNGYKTVGAVNAKEALMLLEKDGTKYDFVVSDVVLPGGSGIDIVKEIRKSYPSVGIVLTSGYSDKKEQCEELIQSGIPFLQKPFDSDQLLEAIQKSKKWLKQLV